MLATGRFSPPPAAATVVMDAIAPPAYLDDHGEDEMLFSRQFLSASTLECPKKVTA